MRQGRFADSEVAFSDDEKEYQPSFQPFDVVSEVKAFIAKYPKLNSDKLSTWAHLHFHETEDGASVQNIDVRTAENLGTLQWEHRFESWCCTHDDKPNAGAESEDAR